MVKKVSLPKGARFNVATGEWSTWVGFGPGEIGADGISVRVEGDWEWNFGSGDRLVEVGQLPTLSPNQKGIVFGPSTQADVRSKITTIRNEVNALDLRFSLLFWDKILIPDSNAITADIGKDGEFLVAEGYIERPKIRFDGKWKGVEAVAATFSEPIKILRARAASQWSLWRSEDGLSIMDGEEVDDAGLSFKLHHVLPVPDKSVPLEDVLEFRARRISEISALRSRLDQVFNEILLEPDRTVAENTKIDALMQAVADFMRVSRERKFPLKMSGFKAKLDYKSLTAGVAGYEYANSQLGLPPALSILSGFCGGVFCSCSTDVGLRSKEKTASPYEYVYSYHKQLFA